jgi:porin
MKFQHFMVLALVSLTVPAHVQAADGAFEDTLLGDWGGVRSALADKGVEVSLEYQGDVWHVARGGKKRVTTYLDFSELRANLDGEKLLGIKGNSMSLSLITTNGTTTNSSTVGSTQGISNSEVANNGLRVFEAWMQQNFFEDRLSLLVGLHDLNSEFSSTPMSDNFIVPTFQIGQAFAQSGVNGPSIYPTTSLGARVKVRPTETSYVALAAYDGIPGDPNRTSGTAVRLGKDDGWLLVGEVGVLPRADDTQEEVNKLAIGAWAYTEKQPDLVTGSGEHSQGVYLLSSYRFYHDATAGHDLGAFLRAGMADGDTLQVDYSMEAGLVANGWVPGRPEAEIGLGVSTMHNGDTYVNSLGGATDRRETIYNLYYMDRVARGISIQPNVLYVVNPGTDQVTPNAWVVGARLGVSF